MQTRSSKQPPVTADARAETTRGQRDRPRRSVLSPQADYWEEDLPGREELQTCRPQLIWLSRMNGTWMEIPCYTNKSWAIGWLLICILIPPFIVVASALFDVHLYYFFGGLPLVLMGLFVILSFIAFAFRAVMYSPRSTPVRFNRKRQKVYVYEFQQSWNPWTKWPVVVKVFDWEDIHGELLLWSGRYTAGYQLSCAVCSPGSRQVLHRFNVTNVVGDIRMVRAEWSHICRYMQGRRVPATPVFRRPPAGWTPEEYRYCWPEDLDRESTTAP